MVKNEEFNIYVLWGRQDLYVMQSSIDRHTEVLSWSLSSLVVASYVKIMNTLHHIFIYYYYQDIQEF
jgi:hypothetical protein